MEGLYFRTRLVTSGLPEEYRILLRWCRQVVVPEGGFSPQNQAIALAELFGLGCVVENPEYYSDGLLHHFRDYVAFLKEMRGGHYTYVPLYSNFPDEVPDPEDYLLKRIVGYVLAQSRWDVPGKKMGTITVPEWLFDLEMFGANPITQFQELELFLREKLQQLSRKKEEHTKQVLSLRFISKSEMVENLRVWVSRCLSSATSLSDEMRADVQSALKLVPDLRIEPEAVPFREHRALYGAHLFRNDDWETLSRFCRYPTDLLRLLVQLAGGDVSLAVPVSFPPLKRGQRRRVLNMLDRMGAGPVVEEQLVKYRGLWLALERALHSGEYQKLFPSAYSLFRRLQKGELKPRFSELEVALSKGGNAEIVSALQALPGGVALRRFSHALCAANDKPSMLAFLLERVRKAALKDQLTLQRVVDRDATATEALILTKRGSTQVIPRDPQRLAPSFRSSVVEQLEQSVLRSMGEKYGQNSWSGKRVFISPELKGFVVPTALRSASASMLTLGRGSRVPLGDGPTLRMFVYWKQKRQRTDLDLSAGSFDDSLDFVGYVSWSRLADAGIVHSGDIQSAPYGAAEFIDLQIDKVLAAGTRYVALTVLRYCGDQFGDMLCSCGWMMRDKPSSEYKTFDIATVQQNLALSGETNYALPVLFDLKERTAIWLDLRVYGLTQQNTIEGASNNLSRLARLGSGIPQWKLTLNELAELHLRTRGGRRVETAGEADIVFSTDSTGDYHPGDWSRVLSELL